MHILRKISFSYLLFGCIYVLSGCSGGDDSPSEESGPINNGILEGTYDNGSTLFPATAAMMSDGSVGIDIDNGVVFYGQLGTDNMINGSENILPNAIVMMSATMNGSDQLVAEITQGAYALNTGDTFTFTYTDIHDRTSSLSNLSGTWSGNNTIMTGGAGVSQPWSITFQTDGSFTGTADNINISGNASLVDASKNEYAISMTLSHDTINYSLLGDYEGFAFLTDDSAMSDTLAIFIKRTTADAYVGVLTLQ